MRVLVAEDDPALGPQIVDALRSEGHAPDLAASGEEAILLGGDDGYDVIVLDLGLPQMDGLSILAAWRRHGVRTPVLILTARSGWSERVEGLDAGADDYLTKPFRMPELAARIRALLRRAKGRSSPVLEAGDVTFDPQNKVVRQNGKPVDLTAQEIGVLSYLLQNAGRYVSKPELFDYLYDRGSERESNTIPVFIVRLRKKLGADFIEARRGLGYRIGLSS